MIFRTKVVIIVDTAYAQSDIRVFIFNDVWFQLAINNLFAFYWFQFLLDTIC